MDSARDSAEHGEARVDRVLVTGANGFVGRAVCARLLREGVAVTAAVRSADRATVAGADAVAVGPIDTADWATVVRGHRAVVHLAARVHRIGETSGEAARAYRRENCEATLALARAAAAAGVERFVFASTIKICGEATLDRPFDGDCTPAPADAYAQSKWEAERGLAAIAAASAMTVAVVRPPLVYGPGVGANFLSLMRLVDRGVPLPFGSVRNRRSLVYVGNLADLLACCARHPQAAGGTFVASDGVDLSTPELIARIASALDVRARTWPCPPALLRAAAAMLGKRAAADRLLGSLQVDASRAATRLGWRPPYGVDEALAATAAWYRSRQAQA